MSDRLGMIHAIHEQPDDDLPRFAYADWLEERGDAERAEFIRVELQLTCLPREDVEFRALFAREIELIRQHKDEWFGTWRHEWNGYEVRRGFIEEVSARSPDAVLPCADWLFSHHALQDLCVWCAAGPARGKWTDLRPLLHHPLMSVLARLALVGVHSPGANGWHSVAALRRNLPLAKRPLALSLHGHGAGAEIVEDLLTSPYLGRVTWLSLAGNAIGRYGTQQLLDGLARMPKLTTLLLSGHVVQTSPRTRTTVPNVGPDAVLALADHPAAAQLEELDLAYNNVSSEGIRALVESPHLGALKRLALGNVASRGDRARLRQRFGEGVELPREE
jgi:uncharacterized protein (TIGR02996 family)